jgi:hypothetical protein
MVTEAHACLYRAALVLVACTLALHLKLACNPLHLSGLHSARSPVGRADWPFSSSCLLLTDFGITAQLLKPALGESPPSAFCV